MSEKDTTTHILSVQTRLDEMPYAPLINSTIVHTMGLLYTRGDWGEPRERRPQRGYTKVSQNILHVPLFTGGGQKAPKSFQILNSRTILGGSLYIDGQVVVQHGPINPLLSSVAKMASSIFTNGFTYVPNPSAPNAISKMLRHIPELAEAAGDIEEVNGVLRQKVRIFVMLASDIIANKGNVLPYVREVQPSVELFTTWQQSAQAGLS